MRWLEHPCDTSALRVGAPPSTGSPAPRTERRTERRTAPTHTATAPAAPVQRAGVERAALKTDGRITPEILCAMMRAAAEAIYAQRARLSAFDGAIGDADHGLTMEIGWKAVVAAIAAPDGSATISALCDAIAEAFLKAVGASAGPLCGSAFQSAGRAGADRLNPDAAAMVAWLAGIEPGIEAGNAARGGARPGDKTMMDAGAPAVASASKTLAAGGSGVACLAAAAEAAALGAAGTRDMISRRGRSRKQGERSRGHIDPGAESAAVLLRARSDAAARRV